MTGKLIEGQNRTLQDMLAAFCTKHDNDWDLWIDAAVFAYNTSRQESLQTSPYEIVFGRIPRLPLELELGLPLKDPSTQSEYTQSLRKVFQEVREVARQNLEKARKKQRKNNEERIQTWRPFAPGETVYLRRPKGWKLGAKWIGPFEIVCRMGVQATFDLIATMLRISHGLGLGISGKMFMRLIGTALLCSKTPRGNIIVFVFLVGKNIIVEGWCNMIL